MSKLRSLKGFTLVEVTIILVVLSILSAILVNNMGDFVRHARFARAHEDVNALCSMITLFIHDNAEVFFTRGGRDGGGRDAETPRRRWDDEAVVGLLIGDGDVPDRGRDSGRVWRLAIDDDFDLRTEGPAHKNITFGVDTFANHLIQNTPNDRASRGYRGPGDMLHGNESSNVDEGLQFDPEGGQAFNSLFSWRGPYIADRVVPDPWGNRYMSTVAGLYTPQDHNGRDMSSTGFSVPVVCYSAGPDEEADTEYPQTNGWVTADDDLTALVSGGSLR